MATNDRPTLEWSAHRVHAWLKENRLDWPQLPIEHFSAAGRAEYVKRVVEALETPGGLEGLFARSCQRHAEADADMELALRECRAEDERQGIEPFKDEPETFLELPWPEDR